jgi:redox-sensitive bicupin YhaK (pirin superfamily)
MEEDWRQIPNAQHIDGSILLPEWRRAKAKASSIALRHGEPIVGQGPFVINSTAELRQALKDYQLSHMGELNS